MQRNELIKREVQTQIVDVEPDKVVDVTNKQIPEERFRFRDNWYAVLVLVLMLFAKMVNQWHRKFLGYAFGYSAPAEMSMDQRAFYEIGASYQQLEGSYGMLSGLAYTLPFSLCGLIFGALSNSVNRKAALGASLIIGGLSQSLTGMINSFPVLCGMRVLHGAANSALSPLSYSLVSDYIPPEKRATANSILATAVYAGISLSSLSILLIKSQGWRWAY